MAITQNSVLESGQTVVTTDATVTDIAVFQTKPGKGYFVLATVLALNNALTQGAGYRIHGTFITTAAGVLSQVSTTNAGTPNESNAAWDATMDASGTTIRVRATGAAATTVTWRANLDVYQVGLEPYNT